jgi:carboxyl-terminal processing protease
MFRRRFCATAILLSLFAACFAQSRTADATKSDPIAYLNRALDEMQARALRRKTVDWPRLRAEALARAAHAETTVDTYDAILFALVSLGDHHSSFHPTPALDKLELQRKAQSPSGLQAAEPPAMPSSPFIGRYEPEGRLATPGGRAVAIVVVTKCFPENERRFVAYETKLQGIVADLDRPHPIGWGSIYAANVGGNMWPMLAGLGLCLAKAIAWVSFSTRAGTPSGDIRTGPPPRSPTTGRKIAIRRSPARRTR